VNYADDLRTHQLTVLTEMNMVSHAPM